jgi:hypothetical protein
VALDVGDEVIDVRGECRGDIRLPDVCEDNVLPLSALDCEVACDALKENRFDAGGDGTLDGSRPGGV